jgi:asparagine synthetase A
MEKAPAIFIIAIGWPLKAGYPHEMRAADYDNWITETIVKNGELAEEAASEITSLGAQAMPVKADIRKIGEIETLFDAAGYRILQKGEDGRAN